MDVTAKFSSLKFLSAFALLFTAIGFVAGCGGGSSSSTTSTTSTTPDPPSSATPLLPSLTVVATHTGTFAQGQQGATYAVIVSNAASAGPTSAEVTVTENIPSGLTLVSMSGTGWTCAGSACDRSDVLNPGASYPAITATVNVASNAASPLMNQVSVTGGNSASASAEDSAVVESSGTISNSAPVLSITKTHSGNFTQGQQGAAFTLSVSNAAGAGATNGTVAVTETVPSGLTLATMAGTGWTCAANICSRSDALSSGASYPAITVVMNVASNASSPQVNQASVSGGGSVTATANDSATISIVSPLLNIVETHAGTFTQGQQGAAFTLTVSNSVSGGPTTGPVTVTDNPSSGLSLVSMSGMGWTCSGTSCSRSDVLNPGASYPAITVIANVASNASSPQVNQVSVSGGSATATTSDSATINSNNNGNNNAPVLSITKMHSGNFTQGQQGASFTLSVSNAAGAGATNGTVAVSEAVPSGLALVSMTGTGWNCGATICSRNDALNAGGSYPPITVTTNVTNNASSPQVNQASVSGGGSATASASDSATIIPLTPVLSIVQTHSGNFTQGQQGVAFTLTVSNSASAGPTSGQVTVAENLPSGLSLVSMTGTGWTCSGASCSRGDVLNPGTSYPAITVTANVASNASSPQVNQVSVSGGGSATASTGDSATILPNPPVLSIGSAHSGNFTQGQQGATFSLTVSNSSSAGPTTGQVTVTEDLASGLSLVSMSGTGWVCSGALCSRSDVLNPSASYPAITVMVNVAGNASSPQVNQVSVSGGGAASASANDSVTINPNNPALSISSAHAGNFTQGQQGATYTVTVLNAAGAGVTNGMVTVTETAPSGLSLVSMTGSGWTCTATTCDRTDTLSGGSSYPPITVTVNVASNATSPQVNQVSVSGGGSANANASDSTRVLVSTAGGASAHFVQQDTTTQGNWQTNYGKDGYSIADSAMSLPSYDPGFAMQNEANTIWNANTSDPRALHVPGNSGGIASTWYSNTSFGLTADFSDGQTHQLALYAVDWDNQQRSETIQIVDPSTNNVLDSRVLSNFYNGAYMVWNITGSFTINVTNNSATAPSAVISGVFFGGGNGVAQGPSQPPYYNPNPPCPSSGADYPVAINAMWSEVGCAAEYGSNEGAGAGCTNVNDYTETCVMDHDAPLNVNDLVIVFDDEDGLPGPTSNPNLTCTDNNGGIFAVSPITQPNGTPWWTAPGTGGSLSGNLLYHVMATGVSSGYAVTCRNNVSGNYIDMSMMVLRKADGTAFSGFDSNSTNWIAATTPGSGCDVTGCLLEVGGSTYTWSVTTSTANELVFWAGNSEGGATPTFTQPIFLDGDGTNDYPYFMVATPTSSGTVATNGLDTYDSDPGAWAVVALTP